MERLGLCLNLSNNALTQWSDIECNGLAVTNGELLSITDDGIDVYSGDTDNGSNISAYITTHTTDHGDSHLKRTRRAVIRGEFQDLIKMTVECDEDNATEYYGTPRHSGEKQRSVVVQLSARYQGSNFSYKVANVTGSDFKVDSLNVLYVLTTRVI